MATTETDPLAELETVTARIAELETRMAALRSTRDQMLVDGARAGVSRTALARAANVSRTWLRTEGSAIACLYRLA